MRIKSSLLCILMFFGIHANAKHSQGGEITYRHISDFTYEISITTYTKTSSYLADRPSLNSVYLGDGSYADFYRVFKINFQNDISKNIYLHQHSYRGPGRYTIYFEDLNRDENICNIPNSTMIPFSVKSEMVVFDPALNCINNILYFVSVPVYFAQQGVDYKVNVGAIDSDDDSLSYQITSCLGAGHLPIPGYTLPAGVSLKSVNGEFIWQGSGMTSICEYNFAIRINEWRKGQNIGYVTRDFQVIVGNLIDTSYSFTGSDSFPSDMFGNFVDTIQVGDTLKLALTYGGSLGATPQLAVYGRAFYLSDPPAFSTISSSYKKEGALQWVPSANRISNNPYIFIFRGSSDFGEEELSYSVYVPGIVADTCPTFSLIPEYGITYPEILLSPNPFLNTILLEFRENNAANVQLEIYDCIGRIVYAKTIFQMRQELNLAALNNGI